MSLDVIVKSLEKVERNLKERDANVAELSERLFMLEQRGGGLAGEGRPSANTLLAKMAHDQGIAALRDRSVKSASIAIDAPLAHVLKAITGDGGANQYDVQPLRNHNLGANPQRRLYVLDALPKLPVTSNSFEFNRLDGYTNAADYQSAEGASKAEGAVPTALVSVPILTVAHWIKCSEQVMADAPHLEMQIANLLQYGVVAKASSEICAGATAGKIQGLATQATAFASSAGATLADAIGEAATALDVAGWLPDLAILHPNDWFAIRSERATTDEYVASGWAGPAEQGLWGLRVATDPAVAAGSPLVLDTSQVAVLDRMSSRVELAREGDDFTRNLITCLGEMRLGLAVFSPTAIRKVSRHRNERRGVDAWARRTPFPRVSARLSGGSSGTARPGMEPRGGRLSMGLWPAQVSDDRAATRAPIGFFTRPVQKSGSSHEQHSPACVRRVGPSQSLEPISETPRAQCNDANP